MSGASRYGRSLCSLSTDRPTAFQHNRQNRKHFARLPRPVTSHIYCVQSLIDLNRCTCAGVAPFPVNARLQTKMHVHRVPKNKPPINFGNFVGFSVIHVSQGSVATYVRCGGMSTSAV